MSALKRPRIERAGILAAGEGSRLWEVGVPKPLARVSGVPLIERTVRGLVQAGARSVACIVNENLKAVERFLREGDFGAQVRVLVRTTESSLFSLLALQKFLEEGPFLLSTTDTILPLRDWEGFGEAAPWVQNEEEALDALLGVTAFAQDEDPLWVEVDDEGLALSIGPHAKRASLVTSGLYAFRPCVFEDAASAAGTPGARLRHLLARLPKRGRRVGTYRFRKSVDVDRPQDLQIAERLLGTEGGG
ncbi:MAG: NDP-sugar synthase [Nitrospinota bacterium]